VDRAEFLGTAPYFWGPAGTSTPPGGITVDLRPGGLSETDADGSMYTMRAVYVEVRRPDRLVRTGPGAGMTTAITFAELADGRTEVVSRQASVPAAYRSPGAQQGFRTSLDRYTADVASLTRKE
jgi:uncharacterized protein YndB with AHSA1/START domain